MPKGISARSPSLTSQESTYSAVIIADMVAEVQQLSEANNRRFSSKEEREKKSDDTITNGTNISKGVILNAIQFGPNENKQCKPPIISEAKKQSSFNEMSSLRKVAFGFSFLPSIMFVLCFSVIFPCEKILPCVDLQWSVDLNDTVITSDLLVPKNVLFTFSKEKGSSGVRSLSELSGDTVWENNLTSPSQFLKCGKFAHTDKESCFIMDNSGTLHLFDPITGRKIWDLNQNISVFSLTVLPDCNKDGIDEIAVATSKSQIKILSIRNLVINNCESNPYNMIAWKKQNGTDLIFMCQKGENEMLMKISQEDWCKNDKNQMVKITTLKSEKAGTLTETKLLPINEGLILWTHDYVTMLNNDGRQLWSVPSYNHSTKNRFLVSGKFRKDKKEVILYSSDSNLQITRLNAQNGNMIQSKIINRLELTEAILIHGEEYDFILGLKKKPTENKIVSQLNEVSTSVITILTDQEMSSAPSSTVIQEITLMEIDGNDLKTIHSEQLDYVKSDSSSFNFTVVMKNNLVRLFVTRNNHLEKSTTIKSITLSNWDASSTEKGSHCVW